MSISMKKILFAFILGLLVSVTSIQAQWTQVGADISGEAVGDAAGRSVSLSSDGSIVAVGIPFNDENGLSSGQVRIYKYNTGIWTQVGQDIDGTVGGDTAGLSVSLSSDGSIVAVGIPFNDGNGLSSGQVRIYKYNDGIWTQIGSDIYGERAVNLGWSVSLSSDGYTVAIGAPYHNENGTNSGQVRIYKYNEGAWTQIGQNINGEAAGDESGDPVSLNSDGSIVAIGAPYNDENGEDSGQVRIYKYNNGTWIQIGEDIDGKAAGDRLGYSVSLSSDGSIVAIGAPYNDDNVINSGQVRIYKNTDGNWVQIGSDIDGEGGFDLSGFSVSLSSDGSIVAIGAPYNDDNDDSSGQVRVYKNTDENWTQIDSDIDGKVEGDRLGFSVSLSSDGSIVAIGAPYLEGTDDNPGHVRVYKNNALNISELKEAGISIYPNPSTGVFNIKSAKDYEIIITDITGKVIYHHTAATVNEQIYLQQSGVYIINFKSQTKNFSSKIIVK